MTASGAAARSCHLSHDAPGRLGPSALQSAFDRVEPVQSVMPCGGLTRSQIDGVSFAGLADLVSGLRRKLAQVVARTPHRG